MDEEQSGKSGPTAGKGGKARKAAPLDRNDRLKAALKANMARRKAQTRARASSDDTNEKE